MLPAWTQLFVGGSSVRFDVSLDVHGTYLWPVSGIILTVSTCVLSSMHAMVCRMTVMNLFLKALWSYYAFEHFNEQGGNVFVLLQPPGEALARPGD